MQTERSSRQEVLGVTLTAFLPGVPENKNAAWLMPAAVSDRSDGKLAHLDGLNLSRSWMLEGIAAGLPKEDLRIEALRHAASQHRDAGMLGIGSGHYEGSHWLGTFALYLVTQRGIAR